jgi:diguanylate cyclase (GGDEF)-like protein
MPDQVLGWPADSLLGKPAELLLASPGSVAGVNPFRAALPVRSRRAWLNRADGTLACMSFACAPLLDAEGIQVGTRGIGTDDTAADEQQANLAAAFRRSEVISEIVAGLRREVLGQDMIRATLAALMCAMGAEGSCVLDATPGVAAVTLLHRSGDGIEAVRPALNSLLRKAMTEGRDTGQDVAGLMLDRILPDGRLLLAAGLLTPYGDNAVLAIWRPVGARAWDQEEQAILAAVAGVTGVLLSHTALQQAMASQASTDPLTGLLNRRAFMGELPRRLERLARDRLPGTLLFADLDNFKALNDRLGHDAGDRTLVKVAELLSTTLRPTDLVARLGGDEFAMWMSGADHMTAAERADALCRGLPGQIATLLGTDDPALGISIGIAAGDPSGADSVRDLIARADGAMYQAKQSGRGRWRVARQDIAQRDAP